MKKPRRKSKIKFDKDGWAMANEYKPAKFDLVKVQNHSKETQFGWWNGYSWDYGLKKMAGEPYKWQRLPRGYEF